MICVENKEELPNCPITNIQYTKNLYEATKIIVRGGANYQLAAGQVPDNWIVNYAGTWVDKKTGLRVDIKDYAKKRVFIYSKHVANFPINHVKMSQMVPCLDPSQTDTPYNQKFFESEISAQAKNCTGIEIGPREHLHDYRYSKIGFRIQEKELYSYSETANKIFD